MPYVASTGTHLPCWDTALPAGGAAERVVLVGRNPSGGLKAKGDPPRATGVPQCVELFAQLCGEGVDLVDGARIALAHNIGGPTAVSAVTILKGVANGTR